MKRLDTKLINPLSTVMLLLISTVSWAQISFVERENPLTFEFDEMYSRSVQFSDIDGDGDQDLFIIEKQGTIKFYRNNGWGDFYKIENDSFNGIFVSTATLADVDGDGVEDMIVMGSTDLGNNFIKLYQNINRSRFIFQEMTEAVFEVLSGGSIAFSDIDNDGDQDVLITGCCGPVEGFNLANLYINDGSGIFSKMPVTPFSSEGSYGLVTFLKIDGDAYEDLLITGLQDGQPGIAQLYKNDGSGNFSEVLGTPLVRVNLSSVAYSDVDGDGDNDILISGRTNLGDFSTNLYLNDGNGNFSTVLDIPFPQVESGSISFSDIDKDGDNDVLITGKGAFFHQTKLFKNDGTGFFTEVLGTPFENLAYSSVSFADVDNDSDHDLILAGRTNENDRLTRLYKNDGNGLFSEVVNIPFDGVGAGAISNSDIDGDGDIDVLILGYDNFDYRTAKLFKNDGLGFFTQSKNTPFDGIWLGSVVFSDIDLDLDQDLIITGENNSREGIAKLYTNDGTGHFIERLDSPFDGVSFSSIAVSDLDEDSDEDVLITGMNNSSEAKANLYKNDGTGGFSKESTSLEGVSAGAVAFSDVDLDGDNDIVLTGFTGSESIAKLYKNNGEGVFAEVIGTPFEGATTLASVAFADVDIDGDEDLVISGEGSSSGMFTKLYKNDGSGNFSETTSSSFEGVRYSSISFSDVDSDGYEDLLITGESNNGVITKLYKNSGDGIFNEVLNLPFENVSFGSISFFDIDGDLDEDLLISGENSLAKNITKLYINETNSIPKISSPSSVAVNENNSPSILDINAFDLEGKTNDVGITYSLISGDIGVFTLDAGNGNLSFINPPNFEDPKDGNSDNVYEITIQASDGFNNVEQDIAITVTDANDTPFNVLLSSQTITENNDIGDIIGLLTTEDEDANDTFTYGLVSGEGSEDNNSFTIVNNELRAAKKFDATEQTTYNLRIQSQDAGGLSLQKNFTITINPEITTLPIQLSDDRYGRDISNYQVISIPYNFEQGKSAVFEIFNEYGSNPDNDLWRMIRYDAQQQDIFDLTGAYQINLGEAYFFIATEKRQVTVENVTINFNPTTLQLKQGWNLIGNPYNEDINWSAVIQNNSANNKVQPLRVINPNEPAAWPENTTLKAFEGGFVFALEDVTLNLSFNDRTNGRINGRVESPDYEWLIPIKLSSNSKVRTIEIGMLDDASINLDIYDRPSIPSFDNSLGFDIIQSNQQFGKRTRDIISQETGYSWKFEIKADYESEAILTWPSVDTSLNIVIHDIAADKLINVHDFNDYHFVTDGNRKFRLYYSSDTNEKFLSNAIQAYKPYPNPFLEGQIHFPLQLPVGRTYQVQLEIFDLTGRAAFSKGYALDPGVHTITWDGLSKRKEKVQPGVYIYQIGIQSEGLSEVYQGKIIKAQEK